MAAKSGWAGLYRERETMARMRLSELFHAAGKRAERALRSKDAEVHRRRLARTVAGFVGFAGGVVVLVGSVLSWHTDTKERNPLLLLAALASVALAYVVTYTVAALLLRRGLARHMALTRDVDRDLERLRATTPAAYLRMWAQGLAKVSLAAPLMAAALLGPLSLHGLLFLCAGEPMGAWMSLSALIVGHAHLALAALGWRYAAMVARGDNVNVAREGVVALGVTGLAAAIPGGLLLMIPPMLTMATGVFIVFPLFAWAKRAVAAEHAMMFAPREVRA